MIAAPGDPPAGQRPAPGSPATAGLSVAARLAIAAAVIFLVGATAIGLARPEGFAGALAAGAGVAAGAAIAIGAIAFFAATRPIRRIARAAQEMAEGDLDARAEVHGEDEIAELGLALNRVARSGTARTDALRAERDLLAGILDGMGEGVLMLDTDGHIVLANRALRAMARIGEEAIGRPLLDAIRNAALKQAIDAANDGDEEAVVREIELGRLIPRKLLVRVSRLAGEGGKGGTIAVFHDVTDLRRLETIRTDFVANVSHELRTPVTAISTAAETLLAGALQDPAEAGDFVDVIDRQAKRLRQLVDDLLDLSKLEAKGFRLALTEVEVGPILGHVVKLMEDPARRRGVTVAPCAIEGGPRVRADRRALEQVVTNLLDNAIKYAGEGANVTLSARRDGERVEISVADNGVGISPAHLGRVFERFYRVDAGRSRELGGTGLGLAIVKHLVELMGGSIEVESELGKGARFTLRLAAA